MNIRRDEGGGAHFPVVEGCEACGCGKTFVDGKIGIPGVLDKPLVWPRVTPKNETEFIPFQPIAHGPIKTVDGRPTRYFDTVIFIDDLILLLEVELVCDNLAVDFCARVSGVGKPVPKAVTRISSGRNSSVLG